MSDSPPVARRVPIARRIYIPTSQLWAFEMLFLAVGVLVAGACGIAFAVSVVVPLTQSMSVGAGWAVAVILRVLVGVLPLSLFLLVARGFHVWWVMRFTALRGRRLARFAAAGAVPARFAHRRVEAALRSHWLWRRLPSIAFADLPPSLILFVDPWRDGIPLVPTPIQVPFEPLRIGKDATQLAHVALADGVWRPRIRGGSGFIRMGFWRILGLFAIPALLSVSVGISRGVAGLWQMVQWPWSPVPWILFLFAMRLLWRAVRDVRVQWFVVPGALVHWRKRYLRRQSVVTVARLTESAVVFDCTSERIVVSAGKKTFACPSRVDWFTPVLAAFLSPARGPTDSELAAWFGPDARIVSGLTRAP